MAPREALRVLPVLGAVGLLLAMLPARAVAECPTGATFTSDPTASVLDVGWTGHGHGLALGSWALRLALGACADAAPRCGACPITSLAAAADRDAHRCADQLWISCGRDADCERAGGTGPCRLYPHPPIPVSAAGVSACAIPAVDVATSGSLDAETGETALALPLTLTLVPGPLDHPCPRCVDDPGAADGSSGGRCDSGARQGSPCGGSRSTAFGATSLDCPPAPRSRVGALTGEAPLALGTDTTRLTIATTSPDAEPIGHAGKRVPCGVCAGTRAACRSDADCPGGPCRSEGRAAPNACVDGVCGADATGAGGVCLAGPFDGRCEPADAFRACSGDTECPAPGDRCVVRPRRCFAGTGAVGERIEAKGTVRAPVASEAALTLGGLFCIAPTPDPQTNDVLGLPGAGRILLPGVLRLETPAGDQP